jgi:hypothetical protein
MGGVICPVHIGSRRVWNRTLRAFLPRTGAGVVQAEKSVIVVLFKH